MSNATYHKLCELSKTAALQQSILSLLKWDQETYMPLEAVDFRASQISLLASQLHRLQTKKSFGRLLGSLIDLKTGNFLVSDLSPEQKACLYEWKRDYLNAIKIPVSFIKELTETTSRACFIWAEARKSQNFSHFAPWLQKVVDLNRKQAQLLGYSDHPYDALLDLFEPEMKTQEVEAIFSRLKAALIPLIKEIKTKKSPDRSFLKDEFPPEAQMKLGKHLLTAMGLHTENSRLDLSHHPFCIHLHPTDIRMTTRIDRHDLMSNIFSVIHEGGHGLYGKGLNSQFYGTPLGDTRSCGIDESQSRWWETRIGRSYPFSEYLLTLLKKEFPQFKNVNTQQFYQAINTVNPSFIRVEADEVTYGMHVILRFEIEKSLIEGSLKVNDIPDVWNQKMVDYLGIKPPNDALGCLQDIHWSFGSIGYFPTYTLGNIYAAQFFKAFEKAYPDWDKRVIQGEFSFINEWLKENIYQWGRQYTVQELTQKISGKALSEKDYIDYLTAKYHHLYM